MAEQTNSSPVFLITGYSTGLGRELALAALSSGFRVIATARHLETLGDLEHRGARVLSLDVTSAAPDLATFAEKAIAVYGQVDYLVNNAGFAQSGAIEEVSPEEASAQFNTNGFGLVNRPYPISRCLGILRRVPLAHFRSRRTGTLVNFNSEATCTAIPGIGIYTATKAAVEISDTWAHELAQYGIRSISIQPSGFRTEFFNIAGSRPAAKTIEGYKIVHGTFSFMATEYARTVPGDPVKAARNIIAPVTKPDLPLRFADAFANLKAFYQKRLEEMEAVRELSIGTNFDA
ncbi:hypothetical protein B0H14DRAFT_2368937 [Mycena olivaceomarginata]|nr:hypothetical protein B0H14DRAFT_2368937 [Mycena olivaceomarginata]